MMGIGYEHEQVKKKPYLRTALCSPLTGQNDPLARLSSRRTSPSDRRVWGLHYKIQFGGRLIHVLIVSAAPYKNIHLFERIIIIT
jgi:hypothetical protein